MTNNITITTTGNAVIEPLYFNKKDEMPEFASIRIASTPSFYSREKKEWTDGTTTWFDIKAFGTLASHVRDSVKKGDPLIVTGILSTRNYDRSDGTKGSSNVIKATAIGHNLLLGNSTFTKGNVSNEEVAKGQDVSNEIAESAEIVDAGK
jgi:single-strand DNA-binding protein